MAFLLTGGTAAQTSVRIALSCRAAGIQYLFASRSGGNSANGSSADSPCVKFDWTDRNSYQNCFQYAFPGDIKLAAVYMIMPRVVDLDKHMNAFIDYASDQGVKRFVLMAGTTTTLGSHGPGKVWEHLVTKGLEFAICKPTWFMDNFTFDGYHGKSIREENKFYTCTGGARIPFVSVDDISSVAFAALTMSQAPNAEYRIVGPEALTHDELASQLSTVLGRTIQHIKVSPEERLDQMKSKLGMDPFYAHFMVFLEKLTSEGKDESNSTVVNAVELLTGRASRTFQSFAVEHREIWL